MIYNQKQQVKRFDSATQVTPNSLQLKNIQAKNFRKQRERLSRQEVEGGHCRKLCKKQIASPVKA